MLNASIVLAESRSTLFSTGVAQFKQGSRRFDLQVTLLGLSPLNYDRKGDYNFE